MGSNEQLYQKAQARLKEAGWKTLSEDNWELTRKKAQNELTLEEKSRLEAYLKVREEI